MLLAEIRAGAFELISSPLLLRELRGVLMRTKFRRYVSEAEVDAFVETIGQESIVVDDPDRSAAGLSEDPSDEYLVALARASQVDFLVSGDPHLTRLRAVLPVLTPREFLDRLASQR